jgi:hypothetical protein
MQWTKGMAGNQTLRKISPVSAPFQALRKEKSKKAPPLAYISSFGPQG